MKRYPDRPVSFDARGKNRNLFFIMDERINEALLTLSVSMINILKYDIRVGRASTAPTEHLFANLRRIMC